MSPTTSSNSIEKRINFPGLKVSSKTKPYAGTRLESVNWQNSMFVIIGQHIGRLPIRILKIGRRLPRSVDNFDNYMILEMS
jgi:hypothetical protein